MTLPSGFDPHKGHGQLLGAMCLMCKHYSPATEGNGRPSCKAFPTAIPDEIFYGPENNQIPEPHLEPLPSQKNAIAFEPGEGVTDEMVAEWDGARAQLMISEWERSTGVNLDDEGEDGPAADVQALVE